VATVAVQKSYERSAPSLHPIHKRDLGRYFKYWTRDIFDLELLRRYTKFLHC